MSGSVLQSGDISALFTDSKGKFRFARWGRDIAPVVFGIDDESLTHLKDGIAATVGISGRTLAETDPELGANFLIFFCSEWDEIAQVPNLDQLLPDFKALIASLKKADATQYRSFTFDDDGAIQMCVLLLRMDKAMSETPIQTLAVAQTVRSLLLWSEDAFSKVSPIAVLKENGLCIVKPEFAALIRAAYDPTLPAATESWTHAMRLEARAGLLLADLEE